MSGFLGTSQKLKANFGLQKEKRGQTEVGVGFLTL